MTKIPGQTRLRFDRASIRDENDHLQVEVWFTFGGDSIASSATGGKEGIGVLKAAAEATLKTVERLVDGNFTCALADIDRVSALGKNLIAVLVNVDFGDREVQVFGSCQVSGSELDSAVKAALHATNRFFEMAMKMRET
ncbi:MAG TPA: hypothetical protein VNO70_18265 [Blastocatellia bacterium]|nr:hypothetical protein [Blastocatellia bacterium]